ncbi:MAG TPA: acetyl-CoA carboxylase carboxyl transferase subunit beta, partial [Pseudonocardiaceae bacterium]|nr:acetyl-CoA carboxylase carboxyl transferase subunit beta [Pseudonocardiaceae bacterium]
MTRVLDQPAEQAAEWVLCERCRALTYGKRFTRSLAVCPECGWHSRLTAWQRMGQLLDPDSAEV